MNFIAARLIKTTSIYEDQDMLLRLSKTRTRLNTTVSMLHKDCDFNYDEEANEEEE